MRLSLTGKIKPNVGYYPGPSEPRALILMYHSIAERDFDPWRMCVTEGNFAEQLAVLSELACPMSLDQLTQRHEQGRIPHRAVVVTFDDGYADNLHTAKPLLEQYGIPATVFVASGCTRGTRGFWWDELEQLIMQPETLPDALSLVVKGRDFQWSRRKSTQTDRGIFQSRTSWLLGRQKEVKPRHALYFALHRFIQPMLQPEQDQVLSHLQTWAGVSVGQRPKYPPLSQRGLQDLIQGGLIEIGAHTVTHALLSAHPDAVQWQEIQHSKVALAECTGQPVKTFSYPYGNYDRHTMACVQQAGFNCACSIRHDCVWPDSDPYQFPRANVENWNGEMFAERLTQAFTRAQTSKAAHRKNVYEHTPGN